MKLDYDRIWKCIRDDLLVMAVVLVSLAIMFGSWHLWGWFIRFHVGDCP